MASVDPAANPLNAMARGCYVDPPNSIGHQIVGRFEIEPSARQLIVGGVGCGKTTQLLVCAQALNEISDISATYVDVSKRQDLGKVQPGCLVALVAVELLRVVQVEKSLSERVLSWARGYYDYEVYPHPDDPPFVQGKISPPETDWPSIGTESIDALRTLAELQVASGKHPVFLFDSMDRISDHQVFSRLVGEDMAALHSCGIGVVLVGPLRSLEGFGRVDVDRFDHLHIQSPIDVRNDALGCSFLLRFLERRALHEVLPPDVRRELVVCSGGVLRDLMALAKLAGEEAYLDGAESISVEHVQQAADRFGRSLLIGLSQDELDSLKQVLKSGRFA